MTNHAHCKVRQIVKREKEIFVLVCGARQVTLVNMILKTC